MTMRHDRLLPCDTDLIQSGFYPTEQPGGGISFRWIGPDPVATVLLPPLPGPLEVTLHVHAVFVRDVTGETRLSLNRGPWLQATLTEDAAGLRLTALLEPGPVGFPGAQELRIDTIRTDSPQFHGAADGRHFALAISAIGLRSLAAAPEGALTTA